MPTQEQEAKVSGIGSALLSSSPYLWKNYLLVIYVVRIERYFETATIWLAMWGKPTDKAVIEGVYQFNELQTFWNSPKFFSCKVWLSYWHCTWPWFWGYSITQSSDRFHEFSWCCWRIVRICRSHNSTTPSLCSEADRVDQTISYSFAIRMSI